MTSNSIIVTILVRWFKLYRVLTQSPAKIIRGLAIRQCSHTARQFTISDVRSWELVCTGGLHTWVSQGPNSGYQSCEILNAPTKMKFHWQSHKLLFLFPSGDTHTFGCVANLPMRDTAPNTFSRCLRTSTLRSKGDFVRHLYLTLGHSRYRTNSLFWRCLNRKTSCIGLLKGFCLSPSPCAAMWSTEAKLGLRNHGHLRYWRSSSMKDATNEGETLIPSNFMPAVMVSPEPYWNVPVRVTLSDTLNVINCCVGESFWFVWSAMRSGVEETILPSLSL